MRQKKEESGTKEGKPRRTTRRLQDYEAIRRIRDDEEFREKWIERRTKNYAIKNKVPIETARKEIEEYAEQVSFRIKKRTGQKPQVHITPKRVGNNGYSKMLGIDSRNLSSSLNRLMDAAVNDILAGYRKGAAMAAVFGQDFNRKFNEYVKERLEKESKNGNQ